MAGLNEALLAKQPTPSDPPGQGAGRHHRGGGQGRLPDRLGAAGQGVARLIGLHEMPSLGPRCDATLAKVERPSKDVGALAWPPPLPRGRCLCLVGQPPGAIQGRLVSTVNPCSSLIGVPRILRGRSSVERPVERGRATGRSAGQASAG